MESNEYFVFFFEWDWGVDVFFLVLMIENVGFINFVIFRFLVLVGCFVDFCFTFSFGEIVVVMFVVVFSIFFEVGFWVGGELILSGGGIVIFLGLVDCFVYFRSEV